MKYFLISQDKKYTDAPVVNDWYGIVDVRNINLEKSYLLPQQIIIPIVSNCQTDFIDVISYPCLLVSENVKNVVDIYNSKIKYKDVVLIDSINKFSSNYYLPILEEIDCLTKKSEYNLDKSVIKKAVINYEKVKGKHMFRLKGVKNVYTVVSLDLVESVLRRDCRGIALKEIEIERD